ncbi:NAD(P)/FAD-dependent oxidoreductase [Aquamicrobium sp. LC103]|uniref:flavin-containing monooxygenase n=1 Tax=Aquamicrobium sp. LC103 TaxID=1120658 RepID=UPI0009E4F9C5|nr:NAD(P)/FAD-dependent oxidoreductase [Aquamicrobium sp. LC103]TKT69782.1 NAD(P)/FAD-dependent oxidoreductase [Aquamicrobium sp. LC103]
MNKTVQNTIADCAQERRIAEDWLECFTSALEAKDQAGVEALLTEDGYWRDLLAHQWDFRSLSGRKTIAAALISEGAERGVHGFAIDPRYSAPRHLTRSGRRVIEVIVAFRARIGAGSGVVRLEQGGDGVYRAWGLMTSLQTLDGYPEAVGEHRPERVAVHAEGDNWLDRLEQDSRFDTEEPEALVVGAGHSGLMIAARLKAMGVRTLVIESLPRVGDVWRNRYHTLQLHNEIYTIDFPYVSYPRTWPAYLPKDMYAAWMEFYALAMELAVWTSVRFEGAEYDEEAGTWSARLCMPDGSQRTVRPRHVVLATGGVSGRKNYPRLPGLDSFAGTTVHSADVRPTDDYRGKRAIVIGTSTSGHDVALELTQRGCEVTLVQRSPTTVVNIDPANLIYALYKEGRSIDEVDVVSIANNFDATLASYRDFSRMVTEMDKDLLEGLEKVGFRTDPGYLGGGYFANYLHRGGGYYLNVGASEYIIDGRIKLIQNDKITGYEKGGARLDDGSLLSADVIVLATGYLNQEADVRSYFGDDVADKVGKVWGWDEGGELRRAWRPTGQKGLWLQLGGVPQSRTYSKLLALQIVAELRDLK